MTQYTFTTLFGERAFALLTSPFLLFSKASQSNSQVIKELKEINRTVLLSEEITRQHIDLQLKTVAVSPDFSQP